MDKDPSEPKKIEQAVATFYIYDLLGDPDEVVASTVVSYGRKKDCLIVRVTRKEYKEILDILAKNKSLVREIIDYWRYLVLDERAGEPDSLEQGEPYLARLHEYLNKNGVNSNTIFAVRPILDRQIVYLSAEPKDLKEFEGVELELAPKPSPITVTETRND